MKLLTRIRVLRSNAPRVCFACLLLAGLLAVLMACPPGFTRETVTIQKSGSNAQLRAADTWLDAAVPASTHAGEATLYVQRGTAGSRRALVLFDFSIVPNAGIKTATMTLNVFAAPNANRTYSANLLTSFWNTPDASWTNRVGTTAWGAAGGDYGIFAVTSPTVTPTSTTVTWTVTAAVQTWYNGTPNYGLLIMDTAEGGGATRTTQFRSMEDLTPGNRPTLTLTFLQNVANLKATPGSNSITLTWTYPPLIGTNMPGESYNGVVILRSANPPVTKVSAPADGAVPALCSTVGSGTVVFIGTMANTTFTDDSSDTCGAPVNGTPYYYKVFTRDTASNYSSNPAGLAAPRDGSSTFTAEAGAVPNPPGSTQSPLWMIGTHSTNLAPPAIMPGSQIDIANAGPDFAQVFALDAITGQRLYTPVALGGFVLGRAPVLDAGDASVGAQVAYLPSQDNHVYAVDTTTGQVISPWPVEPGGLTTNLFRGGAAVQLKKYSGGIFAPTHDLVVVGTGNPGSATTNRIYGLDGNTGGMNWTRTGTPGVTTAMDIINSTPMVDYVHNAIWVTSRSNGGAAQPNLWKLNSNDGTVFWNGNCGGTDIDSSPSLTQLADVLFVGTNGGALYAVNPLVSGATLCSTMSSYTDGADGAVKGFPYIANTVSPYTVVYTTNTQIHAVRYNAGTFTKLWTTTVAFGACSGTCTLSAPVVSSIAGMVYAGGSDGFLYELSLATGAFVNKAVVNTYYPAIVGDPALDDVNQRVYVSTTTNDQRAYAFTIPY